MGTVYSGVGLVSGLDYESIIAQMMKIEARPRDQLLTRISTIDAQKTAYMDISARISALLARIQTLTRPATFRAATATSSLPDVLSATASAGTPPGTYQFAVRALATTHQLISRGFASSTGGLSPGTLTIESARARTDRATTLNELNGGAGVQRGALRITNAAGVAATINIADALTLAEVVERINAAGISVTAAVRDDALVLTDASEGSGGLRVQEVGGGHTAADLGFGPGHLYDTDGDGELAGTALTYLTESSPLALLNDGLGLRRSVAGGDFTIEAGGTSFAVDLSDVIKPETRLERLNHGEGVRLGRVRITSRSGAQTEIDLSGAATVGDVEQLLEQAFGDGRISVTLTGSRLVISDGVQLAPDATEYKLKIEDVEGGFAARDLGIVGETDDTPLQGGDILRVETLADVLSAINWATGNRDDAGEPLVSAAIGGDGRGLTLSAGSGAPGLVRIAAADPSVSQALTDLGLAAGSYFDVGGGARIAGVRIVGGIDTVLLRTLNGGAGLTGGTIRVAAAAGSIDVNLADTTTLAEVLARINDAAETAGLGVEAGLDATGTRLVVTNLDGGTAPITISDVSGTFAADTGLAGTAAVVRGTNLQRRYISENTALADLSNGRGVALGSFKITNSLGQYATVTLNAASAETLQDVINAINALNLGVRAGINATGDGLELVDSAGGAARLKVEEVDGTTARDLNLLGEAEDGRLDGAFEYRLAIGGADTLAGLAARIGNETALAEASVLNDGTALAPYRLNVMARVGGAAGELIVSDEGSGLDLGTLTRAQDARVLYGGGADSGVLLTSADNTFDDVVDGLSFTAGAVSATPVSVTVNRDLDGLVETLAGLVESFNDAMGRVHEVGAYDAETETAGVLLGESTLRTIETRLHRMFTRSTVGLGRWSRLAEVGLKVNSTDGLVFDEEKFRAAYEQDPEAVIRFFTDETHGVAQVLEDELEELSAAGGLIARRTGTLDDRKTLLEDRVEHLNGLLERKQARLLRDFQAMESALSLLQSQQAALADLSSMSLAYKGTSGT